MQKSDFYNSDIAEACTELCLRDLRPEYSRPVHFYLDGGAEVVANYIGDACPGRGPGSQRILKELKGGGWQFYVKDGERTLAVIDQNGLSHINLMGNARFGRIETDANGDIALSNARRYYVTDHLGSTRVVVDNNGTVLETFDYYPGGLLMPMRNTQNAGTLERFTGKEQDDNTNFYYFGARYYDPATLRWGSVDPLAKRYPAWSTYAYALGNPINVFDPDGRMNCPPDCNLQSVSIGVGGLGGLGPFYGNVGVNLTLDTEGLKMGGTIDMGGTGSSQFGVAFPITMSISGEKAPKAGESRTSAFVTTAIPGKGVSGELTLTMGGETIGKFLENPASVNINELTNATGIEFGIGPGEAGGVSGGLRVEETLFTIFKFDKTSPQRSLGNQEGIAPSDATNVVVKDELEEDQIP